MMMMMIKNTSLSFLVLTGMLSGSSANNCSGLRPIDCENTRGCVIPTFSVFNQNRFRFGECVPSSCSVLLSQRDCDRIKGCDWVEPSTCDGIPLGVRDFAEGEALLSLEAAADDLPIPDYDYDYDPYGDACLMHFLTLTTLTIYIYTRAPVA